MFHDDHPLKNFNPLRPWGRRLSDASGSNLLFLFQPAPPVGAETQRASPLERASIFQPAPPVGAETIVRRGLVSVGSNFNPLRPWGRRRSNVRIYSRLYPYFNPLRPWGRRPGVAALTKTSIQFQPAPPVGAETLNGDYPYTDTARFQPAPPVGAETVHRLLCVYGAVISTRSARGGGDDKGLPPSGGHEYFNPLRPWGRRRALTWRPAWRL